MWRDLEEHLRLDLAPHRVHRRREADRLADVGPPVFAVQPVRGLTGHRRHHGDIAVEGALVQEGQGFERIFVQRVHRGRMERDVSGDQPVLEIAAVELRHHRPERGLPSADDRIGRRILACDLDLRPPVVAGTERNAQFLQQALHPGAVQSDRQHAPGTGHPLLQRGAVIDQVRRVREGKRAGRVGRGHFAGAVTHDAIGTDAPGRQQLDQRALDHEDGGLGQLHLVQFCLAGREAGFAQGDVRIPAPLLLDGVDHPPEDGVGVVERAAASGPLGTLSGEDHGHPSLALVHGGHRCGVIHEGVQGFAELSVVSYRECGAGGEVRAAPAEIPRQGVEIGLLLIQASPEVPCAFRQGACGARRQRNHVA